MSNTEIESKARELRELKRMQEELAAEVSALEDVIKAEMTTRAVDEIITGEYRIKWTAYTSSRVDTTALKTALPDIAARFTKITEARRFTVQ